MRFNYSAIYAALEPLTQSSTPAVDALAIVRSAETREMAAQAARDERTARIVAAVEAEGENLLRQPWPFHTIARMTWRSIGNRLEAHGLERVPRERDVRTHLRTLQRKTVVPST